MAISHSLQFIKGLLLTYRNLKHYNPKCLSSRFRLAVVSLQNHTNSNKRVCSTALPPAQWMLYNVKQREVFSDLMWGHAATSARWSHAAGYLLNVSGLVPCPAFILQFFLALVFMFILIKSAFTFVILNDVEKELPKEHTALIYKHLRILTLLRETWLFLALY